MSDMSSLSHEYASSADFSRSLNEAVLLLKKRVAHAGSSPPSDRVQEALSLLQGTLTALGARLKRPSGPESDVSIPEDVYERIVEEHRGCLPHFQQVLQDVLAALSGASPVQRSELDFLDALCGAADASASATFRKLWRR